MDVSCRSLARDQAAHVHLRAPHVQELGPPVRHRRVQLLQPHRHRDEEARQQALQEQRQGCVIYIKNADAICKLIITVLCDL